MVRKGRDRRIRTELHRTPASLHSSSDSGSGSSSASTKHRDREIFWNTVLNREESSNSNPTASSHIALVNSRKPPPHSRSTPPFSCDICNTQFSQRPHLNAHIRAVHEGVKPFHCEMCCRRFAKRFDLVSHMSAVHYKERPHTCGYCHKAFAKRFNVTRHERQVHPEYVSVSNKRARLT